MRPCKRLFNRLNVLSFVVAQLLLSVYADAMAWTGYPARYPAYWQPPMAYQAVPVGYGRPAWPVPGYPYSRANPTSGTRTVATETAADTAPDDDGTDSVAARKSEFISSLLPVVNAENERLLETRRRLVSLQQRVEDGTGVSQRQRDWLGDLAEDYRVDSDAEPAEQLEVLLRRVDVIPVGLAIAQAANESAWGTSRFAREGNNLFGVWTWDKDAGIVPRQRAEGKTHRVRVYGSTEESVRDYMLNLNSHPAYRPLRVLRAELREQGRPLSALRLAEGLDAYSELGDEYIRRIQSTIRGNDLEQPSAMQLADAT